MFSVGVRSTKSGFDCVVGGDQGIATQEKKEEIRYRSGYDFFGEQLQTLDKRKSHSKEGLVRLMIISYGSTSLHGLTHI